MGEENNSGKIIAVVLVLIIAVAGLIIFMQKDNGNHAPIPILNKTGTLNVDVNSNHIMFPADYTLSIDGNEVSQFSLSPFEGMRYTKQITIPAGQDSKSILVEVKSTGGGFGNDKDSKRVTIYADNASQVSLSA